MPVTDGALPTDIRGAQAGSGYSPNVGTIPVQLGAPTSDNQGQPSAPLNTYANIVGQTLYPFQANVFAPGHLRVAPEASQVFYDAFDTGLDITNRWNAPTNGNGGIAAISEVADTRLGTGTSANGYSVLQSQTSFLQANPGFLVLAITVNLEFPLTANAYRFWGFATSPATPTATAPLTEAAGWEMTTAGKLVAVTYQTGTRVIIQDLSTSTGNGKQPQDANTHKYFLYYRGDLTYWAVDNPDNIVATMSTGAPGPNVNALPIKFLAVGGATPPVSNTQLQVNSVWVGDTAHNNAQLSDGVFTWRKATITALHNQDNQALPTSPASYGLLTGGVAQLINPLGNLDRQREAGQDQVSPLGVSLGATAFAQAFATTVPTTGTLTTGGASGTITPASMTGVQVGAILTVDTGANAETVVVTALPSGTTATVVPTNGSPSSPAFLHTHTPSYTVTGFMLNQERDASGENSGASGKGTAVAAEYEYNSGGPPLANGTPSQLQYDREVSALGNVTVNAGAGYAITSTTTGNTSLTLTTPANGATLTPGQWIRLSGSGTNEYVRVADSYVIAPAPASVPLTSPVVNSSQTTATWAAFGANGPGQSPVLWTGEGLEGVLLNDRTSAGFGRLLQGNMAGEAAVTTGGLQTTQVTPTSLTVIKASPGRLARVLCSTANATNAINIYDNATTNSGTIIGVIPTTATAGQIFDLQMPAANGITVAATASAGTITVCWS
jgi:hypothetical protein